MPIPVIKTSLSFGATKPLPKQNVDYLVVHTQGAPGNSDGSAASIHQYHKLPKSKGGRGWSGIGYHFVVRQTGKVEEGRPIDRQGAHVEGVNHRAVGIVCSGHGDLADFTPKQKQSLRDLIVDLRAEFSGPKVQGHRKVVDELIGAGALDKSFRTTKTCPGTRINLGELQQLIGLDATPRPGERRWSNFFKGWIHLVEFVSDAEWYFVRGNKPNAPRERAGAPWSQMPLGPG